MRKVGRSNIPEQGLVLYAGVGATGVKSDICGSLPCNNIGPYVSLGALYKMTSTWGINVEANYLRLGAKEKVPELNVAFQSEVIEVSGSVIINLLDSYSGSGNYRSSRKRFVVPYVKVGGGFIYYTATSYPSESSSLNESGMTYDPERKYPAIAGVVPFGGGLRFRFSDYISVAPELMYHYTTSDYLDNIGPRIMAGGKSDHFAIAAIRVMYTPSKINDIFSKKR
ncbi:thrombospondin type 3 repeat-containing protein [Pontibacter sp. SGAir0037]|nr:thrombospondin type 3 repeat-containing protein [Pontibacter sp. SGAir0037]